MKSGTLNMQWCAAFVSCMFLYEFGLEAAKTLLCKTLHCYTPTGAKYFKDAGRYTRRGKGAPEPGDVVFFYSSAKKRIGHVGIVTKPYTVHGCMNTGADPLTGWGGNKLEMSVRNKSGYVFSANSVKFQPYNDSSHGGTAHYQILGRGATT